MASIFLLHHAPYQALWQQPGMIQCGPNIVSNDFAVPVVNLSIQNLQADIASFSSLKQSILLYYTDPFLLRASALTGLHLWRGPKILVCGDLHHGPHPLETLKGYLAEEKFDAVILAFNPSLLGEVRKIISLPVFSFPPSFFRYPKIKRSLEISNKLIHVGSIGNYHSKRRAIVHSLLKNPNLEFSHFTTKSQEEASILYSSHSLALNIPLNNDLNHRFFEIMSAGCPQIILADKSIVGHHSEMLDRPDLFWASSEQDVQSIANKLLANPDYLQKIPVSAVKEWNINDLIKCIYKKILYYESIK